MQYFLCRHKFFFVIFWIILKTVKKKLLSKLNFGWKKYRKRVRKKQVFFSVSRSRVSQMHVCLCGKVVFDFSLLFTLTSFTTTAWRHREVSGINYMLHLHMLNNRTWSQDKDIARKKEKDQMAKENVFQSTRPEIFMRINKWCVTLRSIDEFHLIIKTSLI